MALAGHAFVMYYVKGEKGFTHLFGHLRGGTGQIVGAPSLEVFDPRVDLLGRIARDLAASAELELTQEEARGAHDALKRALGVTGTKLHRSWPMVQVAFDGPEGYFVSTRCYGRRESEQSWPWRRLPETASSEELADLFRRMLTTAERFFLEHGMMKGELTFPDNEGLDDE